MGTTRLKFKNIAKAEFMDTLVKIILPREPSIQKMNTKNQRNEEYMYVWNGFYTELRRVLKIKAIQSYF